MFSVPSFATSLRSVVLAVAVASLAACGEDSVSPELTGLTDAEALWNRTRPASGSYVIAQQVACFCADGGTTYQVTVTSGVITRVRDPDKPSDLAASEFTRFRTVDQLFTEVRSALAKDGVLTSVAYDPTMGFPTTVRLDRIPNAVDDEVAYFTNHLVTSS